MANRRSSCCVPLSATSALVLLWAGRECYPSRAARQYLSQLDLSAGQELYKQCDAIWPYYAEVIRNRKFAVMSLMERCVDQNSGLKQVVVAGAGLAPLSVEWLARKPDWHVFDVDCDNMSIKARQVTQLGIGNLHCVHADLASPEQLRQQISEHGWRSDKPTLLVVEGVSYYLSAQVLADMVEVFRSENRESRVVVEYLCLPGAISADRRHIPDEVFGIIARRCNLEHITRYDLSTLQTLLHAKPLARLTMQDIEQQRCNSNGLFPTHESGWIEVALLAV